MSAPKKLVLQFCDIFSENVRSNNLEIFEALRFGNRCGRRPNRIRRDGPHGRGHAAVTRDAIVGQAHRLPACAFRQPVRSPYNWSEETATQRRDYSAMQANRFVGQAHRLRACSFRQPVRSPYNWSEDTATQRRDYSAMQANSFVGQAHRLPVAVSLPPPTIYLGPDYQRELRRRVTIIKEFSGQNFMPAIDELVKRSQPNARTEAAGALQTSGERRYT
jgi:hypothetical protein